MVCIILTHAIHLVKPRVLFSFAEIRGLDENENDEIDDLLDLYPESYTETHHVHGGGGTGGGGGGVGGNGVGDYRNRTKHRHHADAYPSTPSPSASTRLVPPFYRTFEYL